MKRLSKEYGSEKDAVKRWCDVNNSRTFEEYMGHCVRLCFLIENLLIIESCWSEKNYVNILGNILTA